MGFLRGKRPHHLPVPKPDLDISEKQDQSPAASVGPFWDVVFSFP